MCVCVKGEGWFAHQKPHSGIATRRTPSFMNHNRRPRNDRPDSVRLNRTRKNRLEALRPAA